MTSMIVVKKYAIAAIAALALAACTTQEQQRGTTGAVIGGVAAGFGKAAASRLSAGP